MQIDWAQIVTHVIGFLIAVWLIRRYAWDKLLRFIEHRRETIAASFSEIEKGKEAVAERKRYYEQELDNIEATRRARILDADRKAEQHARKIMEEARQDSVDMRQKAKRDVALEIDKANVVLKDRMVEAVCVATEKILKEKLDRERHARLVESFLDQVKVE